MTVAVSDNCDTGTKCQIISIVSNEHSDDHGDVGRDADWQITGPLTARVRAEHGDDRRDLVYTITVRCTDASGNSATKNVAVTVLHDRRERRERDEREKK